MIAKERFSISEQSPEPLSREEVLAMTWKDKRERRERGVAPTLFVSLARPEIDGRGFLIQIINQLKENPQDAFIWEDNWGKTVVGVSPYAQERVTLLFPDDPRTKSVVPIRSVQTRPAKELIQNPPQEGRYEIIVNSAPTTIEGAVIAFTHLIGSLVWEQAIKISKEDPIATRKTVFDQALNRIVRAGIKVYFSSEDEIFNLKTIDPKEVTIRLYGSRKARQTPDVLGAVRQNLLSAGQPLNLEVVNQPPSLLLRQKLKETRQVKEARPVVCGCITFGKPLHAGHLLNLAFCQMIARNTGAEKIILSNNNTGPRAARTVATIAQKKDLAVEDAYRLLTQAELPAKEVITAYKQRRGTILDPKTVQQALVLVESGSGDVFSAVTTQNRKVLNMLDWPIELVSEAAEIKTSEALVKQIAPEWSKTGFISVPVKGLVILQKQGFLTASGKNLALLKRATDTDGSEATAICVDSEKDTADAIAVARSLGIQASQIPGVGISFGLETASGTQGQALTINEIIKIFERATGSDNLSQRLNNGLIQLLSAHPCRLAPPYTLFEFKDNETFMKAFIASAEKATEFLASIRGAEDKLRSLPISVQSGVRGKIKEFSNLLVSARGVLTPQPVNRRVDCLSRPAILPLGSSFNKIKTKIAGRTRDDPTRLIIEALLEGRKTSSQIFDFVRQAGFSWIIMPGGAKDFPVESPVIDAISACGYTGERASDIVMAAIRGKIKFGRRKNPAVDTLKRIIRISEDITAISEQDKELLLRVIKELTRRSGYEL